MLQYVPITENMLQAERIPGGSIPDDGGKDGSENKNDFLHDWRLMAKP